MPGRGLEHARWGNLQQRCRPAQGASGRPATVDQAREQSRLRYPDRRGRDPECILKTNSKVVLKVNISNFPMSYYLVHPPFFLPLGTERLRGGIRQDGSSSCTVLPLSCILVSCCLLSTSEIFTDPLFSFRAVHSLQLVFKAI